jgi:NADPH-dependent ferric siderophore reductase
MELPLPARRVLRVRHELRQREVEVLQSAAIGANFISVTFKGDALEDFASASFDDHVKFISVDANGELVRRIYTPRHFNREARELTIEFACHGAGKASDWARHAVAGQRAVIVGPSVSLIIPMDYDWHLLAGDVTALPAIHRRLDELPSPAKVIVIVAADAADRRDFATAAQLELQWVSSTDDLVAAIHAIARPPGEGFAWCAGEASQMARVRETLARGKGLPKVAMRVAAYWKRGAVGDHANVD